MKNLHLCLIAFAAALVVLAVPAMSAHEAEESNPYAKFMGMHYEQAEAELKKMHPEFQIQTVPQGAMVTKDHKMNRIRLVFDPATKLVVGVPRRG